MPWFFVLFLSLIVLFVINYLERRWKKCNDLEAWQNEYEKFYKETNGYRPYAWRNYRKKK